MEELKATTGVAERRDSCHKYACMKHSNQMRL